MYKCHRMYFLWHSLKQFRPSVNLVHWRSFVNFWWFYFGTVCIFKIFLCQWNICCNQTVRSYVFVHNIHYPERIIVCTSIIVEVFLVLLLVAYCCIKKHLPELLSDLRDCRKSRVHETLYLYWITKMAKSHSSQPSVTTTAFHRFCAVYKAFAPWKVMFSLFT